MEALSLKSTNLAWYQRIEARTACPRPYKFHIEKILNINYRKDINIYIFIYITFVKQ